MVNRKDCDLLSAHIEQSQAAIAGEPVKPDHAGRIRPAKNDS